MSSSEQADVTAVVAEERQSRLETAEAYVYNRRMCGTPISLLDR